MHFYIVFVHQYVSHKENEKYIYTTKECVWVHQAKHQVWGNPFGETWRKESGCKYF